MFPGGLVVHTYALPCSDYTRTLLVVVVDSNCACNSDYDHGVGESFDAQVMGARLDVGMDPL